MPETMRPREKVARTVSPKCWDFYDRHASDPRMKAEVNHEVATSLQLADAIFAALASSGDHAELARLAEAERDAPTFLEASLMREASRNVGASRSASASRASSA